MLTLSKINHAIELGFKDCLAKKLDFKVVFMSYYIKEPIVQGSLKVFLRKYKRIEEGKFIKARKLDYSLYFFARDMLNPTSDNLAVEEVLSDLLYDGIKLSENYIIYFDDVEFNVSDDVLVGSFSFTIYEELDEDMFIDNNELIENLNIKLKGV